MIASLVSVIVPPLYWLSIIELLIMIDQVSRLTAVPDFMFESCFPPNYVWRHRGMEEWVLWFAYLVLRFGSIVSFANKFTVCPFGF